jgi:hypothetical protein
MIDPVDKLKHRSRPPSRKELRPVLIREQIPMVVRSILAAAAMQKVVKDGRQS